jgi:two-component system sensor histidine kinase/response regulator
VTSTVTSPRVALVVDDDPDLALLCALHLQGAGYQVLEAYTGAQALDLARTTPPAVVVLDRMLTDCDGLDVLAALRDDVRLAGIPVVMVSARAQDQDRLDARRAGAQDYVVKPFDAEQLVAAVDGVLDAVHRAVTPQPTARTDRVADLESELGRMRDLERHRAEHLRTLSHDFRTPLTAVKGFGEWLLLNWDNTPDERKRQLLGRIVEAGGRLDQMVEGLLEHARLERGALQVDLAPHRLSELLEVALRKLAPALENHAVDVRLEEDATVLVDLDAMVRVMENLLSNAAKFSPPGSTVHITAQAAPGRVPAGRTGEADEATTADGVGTVLLSVRDEGMGIETREQERVFDRYYRVPSEAVSTGSGIGLALVKEYVEAQDGSVELSSAPGEGSDFRVRLRTVPGQR